MSGHADTLAEFRALLDDKAGVAQALDALLAELASEQAENQRYEKALRIAMKAKTWESAYAILEQALSGDGE